jgi:hypothetical protein
VTTSDRFAAARAVADATLYEGYVLYPYRASSGKNQVRWQFGVLAPPSFCEADGSERSSIRTECILDPGPAAALAVRIRGLQIQRRDGPVPWDEGVEHVVDLPVEPMFPLARAAREAPIHLDAGMDVEETADGDVTRRREAVDGLARVHAEWAEGPGALVKVVVTVENRTAWSSPEPTRDQALARSLIGVHTMLAVDDGSFVSLIDPPDFAVDAAKGCVNDGTYPVLIGSGDVVLSSPIILYDHPEVAPESPGDLFDALEIDEILGLRVLTLTEAEKAEARQTDARAAAIIDRCDEMPPEVWSRLHGAIRTLSPTGAQTDAERLPWWEPAVDEQYNPYTDSLVIGGKTVTAGTAVRLRPSRRADAHDMFLSGMAATVAGIYTDVDDEIMVAVTVDDDPAAEALAWQRRGLFFHPDELEVVG